jgi:hypothetical protein
MMIAFTPQTERTLRKVIRIIRKAGWGAGQIARFSSAFADLAFCTEKEGFSLSPKPQLKEAIGIT